MHLKKIISGGQTGVDQAALNAALTLDIECGGWCPPGRICDNGKISDYFPLEETPEERSKSAPKVPRSLRTEWNVRDSDATMIVKPVDHKKDTGLDWTLRCIESYNKPSLAIDPYDNKVVTMIKKWLRENSISVLNIAGPSEKRCPGISSQSYKLFIKIFNQPDAL